MIIMSWNVEGRLARTTTKSRGTPDKILDLIEKINPDVCILPEAFDLQPEEGVNEHLQKMGYIWQDIQYGELDRERAGVPSTLTIRVLSKLKIIKTDYLRWADARSLLAITVKDPQSGRSVRFIATHLDERSEERRLAQIKDAARLINSQRIPTVMLGDFNAMHFNARSRLIRSRISRILISLIPHKGARGRARTLVEMASGRTLSYLENATNLRDADLRHRPTTTPKLREMEWMPSIRMAQIDHIFVTPTITVDDFHISKDGGSDHRAISANIHIKTE